MQLMSPPLDSLRIRGFRGFLDLTIERLAQVNLFVGKNNSGKTSIVEAIQLYYSGGERNQISQLLIKRDEYKLGGRGTESVLALESLFYGRPNLEHVLPSFTIGPNSKRHDDLVVQFEWLEERIEETDGAHRFIPVAKRPDLFGDAEDLSLAPGISVSFGGRQLVIPMSRFQDRILRSSRTSIDLGPLVYLSSAGMAPDEVNAAWDTIALTQDEDVVVQFLRIIIPTLEKLAVVESPRQASTRILLAKLRQFERPVPLKSLGEGVNHLLGIVLGLVRARGGILIVDEIENGIHYSVQDELWRIVFEAATAWDVQVFATTHSWDCVKGFSGQTDHKGVGMLFRVEAEDDNVKAIEFTPDEIDIAVQRNIEVR